MHHKSYGQRPSYPAIASTIALVFSIAALCIGGAMASGVIVTSKQIKNGTLLTQDFHRNAVKTKDVANGTITSADIGEGEVHPGDVTMPPPAQLQESPADTATAEVTTTFGLVDVVGSYTKEDPTSALEVDWTGTAAGSFSSCIFQLRVDGQPAGTNAGEVYVGGATSVAASALFTGLGAGPHQVEIWAKHPQIEAAYSCTVGPASAGIGQTIVVSEQVI